MSATQVFNVRKHHENTEYHLIDHYTPTNKSILPQQPGAGSIR
jgi:hypothetical protein